MTTKTPQEDLDLINKLGLDMDSIFDGIRDSEPTNPSGIQSRRSIEFQDKKARAQRLAIIMSEISPQQSQFVIHYCKKDWETLSEVAIRAGSKATGDSLRKIAYQYLGNDLIKEAIVLMTWRKLEAEGIDRHEVLGMLKETYNAAMADGKYKEATEATQLLGTAIGMFDPRKVRGLTSGEGKALGEINGIAKDISKVTDPERISQIPSGSGSEVLRDELLQALKITQETSKN